MDRYIHLTSKSKNFDNNEISKKILGNFIHFNVLGKTTVDGAYMKNLTLLIMILRYQIQRLIYILITL